MPPEEGTPTQDPAPAGAETNPEHNSGGGESGHSGPDPNALAAELRKARKQLKQLEQREAERAKAEMTELDRLKAERDEAMSALESERTRSSESTKRNAFRMAAIKNGAVDPEAALKLADLSGLEIAEDGTVTGVEDVIKGLKKSYASLNLFGSAPPHSAASGGGNPSNGAPKVTAKKIEEMSNDEYRKWRESVIRGEVKI